MKIAQIQLRAAIYKSTKKEITFLNLVTEEGFVDLQICFFAFLENLNCNHPIGQILGQQIVQGYLVNDIINRYFRYTQLVGY